LVKRAETVQVHFTHEGEGLKAQGRLRGRNVYMESYMVDYGEGFMVSGIFIKPTSKRWAWRKF
jgi:hypothetical protein